MKYRVLTASLAMTTALVGASSAFAQSCQDQAETFRSEITQSSLSEDMKTELTQRLEEAANVGSPEECQQIVASVEERLSDGSTVTTQASDTTKVEGQAAEVTAEIEVEQARPQVTVTQQRPTVKVDVGKPIVTIRIPEPEITVQMPEPIITIEQADPDVQVSVAPPSLSLDGQETQALDAEATEPVVNFQRDEAAPQVEVVQQEPEIRVEQAEAKVNVERVEASQEAASEKVKVKDAVTAASTEEQAATAQAASLTGRTANELLGATVYNMKDEAIADIDNLVRSAKDDEVYAVLGVGGFLGIGEKEVAIALSRMKTGDEGYIYLPQETEASLESMDAYDPARYEPI